MTKISKVTSVVAYEFKSIAGKFLVVAAQGEVDSTGWDEFDLELVTRSAGEAPESYPEKDASNEILEFEFVGNPPRGGVGDVKLPVAALTFIVPPTPQANKVRIIAGNYLEVEIKRDIPEKQSEHTEDKVTNPDESGDILYKKKLAKYDDSHQPTGKIVWDGWTPHAEWKKLVHTLKLEVRGPNLGKIVNCIEQATVAAALAALIAAYYTGGAAAIAAAKETFLIYLKACLASGYSIKIHDKSKWEYWLV